MEKGLYFNVAYDKDTSYFGDCSLTIVSPIHFDIISVVKNTHNYKLSWSYLIVSPLKC